MMSESVRVPDVCIRETGTSKGKGVFALRDFAEGEIVEVAPVLVLKTDFEDLPVLLTTYVFDWTAMTGIPRAQGFVLGYGSMYNHSNPSSLVYLPDARANLMHYVAARPITAGEELTINYNAGPGINEWHDDNWFERNDVALIEED